MKKAPAPSLHASPSARQRGFTLIEVMVALIVLVLGVLGASAMTLTALRDSKQSSLRSQATALAYEMGDLMRMNPGQEGVFTGGTPTGSASCYAGSGCSPATMAANDYRQWLDKLQDPVFGLPGAAVTICRDSANATSMTNCDTLPASPLVVKLRWDEKRNDGTIDLTTSRRPELIIPLQPY